jgi:phosphoribosylformylglycinamidine synthase subunit PurQ / glutaminase
MKAGVVVFPGSNCDQDLINVLQTLVDEPVEKLWHKDTDLKECTHVFLPGGFSYGDYLRSGAIAKLSPVMGSVVKHANNGGFVMGICNGFQILCETGLLPGALLRNTQMKFLCDNVFLRTENIQTALTRNLLNNPVLKIPIAHGEGRFFCDSETLDTLEKNKQIVFRYCNPEGQITEDSNPNGSLNHIAGICNETFNVFGMMPHPERCANPNLFNTDGLTIFESLFLAETVV